MITVATGITVTTAAAASGVSPQPSVSRITSRKSAAVRPAESRPRATSGAASFGPSGPGSGGCSGSFTASGTSSSSGAWTRKIDCQLKQLGQHAADGGAEGDADRPGRAPEPGAAAWLPRSRASSSIAQAIDGGSAERLDDAGGDQGALGAARARRRARRR